MNAASCITRRFFFGSSQKDPVEEKVTSEVVSEKSIENDAAELASEPESQPKATVEAPLSPEEECELSDLNARISDLKEKLSLATADSEQAAKRHAQAMEDVVKYAHSKAAKGMLELADNLRRVHEAVTSDAIATDPKLAEMISDVRRVEESLTKTLKEFGIEEETSLGKKFDPNIHEAMFELPLPHHQPGTVAHVLQTGWLIHDRVLRPARVGVSK